MGQSNTAFNVTDSGGTALLYVGEDGKVGIGTPSPQSALHVTGTDHAIRIDGLSTDYFLWQGGTNDIALKRNGIVKFWLRANEDVLFKNIANVGIGTANPQYKLHVNGSVAGIGPYQDISDLRYKRNIETIPNALDKVIGLRGVHFDWREDEFPELNFEAGRQIGFIAQQVKEVLPQVVSQDENGDHGVAYSQIVPVLVEAIKAQQEIIEKQQTELDSLKAKMAQFESALQKLEALTTGPANDDGVGTGEE